MSEGNVDILCQDVWKVFGPNPDSIWDTINNGADKQEVLEQTGHVIAVKDVSFEVKENEMFVVMGLSGSGKSTLIRCINRLIEPTKGTIFVQGTELAQMDENELRELRRNKLSMVFQHFGLLPHRSVEDNVAFGLEVRGEHGKEREEKIAQALDLVGLKGWEKSRIHELSGGMQQRVGLARSLAVGAEFMYTSTSCPTPVLSRTNSAVIIPQAKASAATRSPRAIGVVGGIMSGVSSTRRIPVLAQKALKS